MDTNMTTLTPSATTSVNKEANGDQQQQQFFDTTGMYHQQIMQQQQQQHQQHHYQQYFQQAQQAAAQNQVTTHLPLGFNPLTPPGLPQAILPALPHFYTQPNQQQPNEPSPQLLDATYKSVLTPRHTPPMDITPPKSPKASNTTPNGHQQQQHQDQQQQNPELTSNSSKDLKYIADSDGEESIRLPIYNSHGKMKNYRCKSCGSVAITKLAFWEHAKTHMKPEKILRCEKCPFVTELKHHLEYHIRKHKNLKPFQCDKCSYSCVNKSMLNSHLKSHSSVYQYRCVDCPYVTKYVHSFKLHLRKQDHKPGMVLDEAGIPNPSVVIDVYGTRRGPKNKGVSNGCGTRKSNNDFKMSAHHHHQSQLSAALQGIPLNSQNHSQQNQMSTSPAKSSSSVIAELPALTLNISLQQQKQQQQQQEQQQQQKQQEQQQESQNLSQSDNIANLLPSLASLLQQNSNMAFFPFRNINLQVLAAQQQAAVLAQLSPRMREQLQKYRQENNQEPSQNTQESEDLENDGDSEADDDDDDDNDDKCSEEEEEDQEQMDSKSVDSAMDLSQGTPTKEDAQQQQTPQIAINFKLPEDNIDTPLFPSTASNRRKGRVLKLDNEQQKNVSSTQSNLTQTSSQTKKVITTVTVSANNNDKMDDTSSSSADERMEVSTATNTNTNNSRTSTASSSVKSSNSSSTTSNGSTANSSPSATPTMYECKYCDISFKNAVLYTIHMGYHSCDDVFKCNMCGEKCDGPVGLFVHIAHYAHS